ncbi:hypothetical protein G1C95_0609 [Bifidobacterium sp. DSM 109957]|uniref:Uncharacterized protein n=1 Tax=Bifidobacterium oedipodis TaxID=2675322 RepID=A0A7Y0HT98_9BIFI|nr:hypothetical protein [Bifidobacterium sp. DSM 109957]
MTSCRDRFFLCPNSIDASQSTDTGKPIFWDLSTNSRLLIFRRSLSLSPLARYVLILSPNFIALLCAFDLISDSLSGSLNYIFSFS